MGKVATELQERLRNDLDLRAHQFERAIPYSNKNTDQLLQKAREMLAQDLQAELGEALAKTVANTLAKAHLAEFSNNKTERNKATKESTIR